MTTAFIIFGNAPKAHQSEEYFTDLRERHVSPCSALGRLDFAVFSGLAGLGQWLKRQDELFSFYHT